MALAATFAAAQDPRVVAGGPFAIQAPLGRELNSITTSATSGKQFVLRLTGSVAVTNTDGYLEVEE